MSYYGMDSAMYQQLPPATPGWQFAPVPGWGTNPLRAGPERVGVGGEASSEASSGDKILAYGILALVVAGVAWVILDDELRSEIFKQSKQVGYSTFGHDPDKDE